MMATDSTFRIDNASPADLTQIVQLNGRSFINDRHTQLKAVVKGFGNQPEDVARYHAEGIQSLFESAFQNPKNDVIVAKDSTGKVVGTVIWAQRGLEAIPSDHEGVQNKIPKPYTSTLPPYEPPDKELKTIVDLGEITNSAMRHYVSHLMPPDAACRYIVSISVDPAHQGQGVGKALVNWGIEKADKEGVPCWVSSSHDGIASFQKRGFCEVGRLDLCLDDWAEGHARPSSLVQEVSDQDAPYNSNWGQYSWTWLVREPKS